MKNYFLIALLFLFSLNANAQRISRIDDSRTVVLTPIVKMDWASEEVKNTAMIGTMVVDVHLNLEKWQGQTGNIYMLLSSSSSPDWIVKWKSTSGKLRDGGLRYSERTLVYSGPINFNSIEDRLQFSLSKNAALVERRNEKIEFLFEFETN